MNNNIYLESLADIEKMREFLDKQQNTITQACAAVGYCFVLLVMMVTLFILKSNQYKKEAAINGKLRKEIERLSEECRRDEQD